MKRATECEHTDRPVRARGLCGSCYVVAHRKGQFTPKYRYTDDLIDEIEHAGLDWPGVQAEFGKSKHCITMALLRRGEPGRKALDGLQARTYGVVGQANIVSKVNKKGLGR